MAFSGALTLTDLNDFITPSQACIKPVEQSNKPGLEQDEGAAATEIQVDSSGMYYEVSSLGGEANGTRAPAQKLETAHISLNDCLACSGCITSAESVLITLQSHTEVLNFLTDNPPFSSPGHRTPVISIAPQSLASLAAAVPTTSTSTTSQKSLVPLHRVLARVRAFCTHELGFEKVHDTTFARHLSLLEHVNEFWERKESHTAGGNVENAKLPMLASACPGWVCYAEKTHGEMLPFISRSKSPQQVMGTLVKNWLGEKWGKKPDEIYHVTVMPCYDKKLEASRQDFYSEAYATRDVDCVLTTGELELMMRERGWDLSLPVPGEDDFVLTDISASSLELPELLAHRGSSSGSYLASIIASVHERAPIGVTYTTSTRTIRNADYEEYTLRDSGSGKVVFRGAKCYGFRNLQNVVRKVGKGAGVQVGRGAAGRMVRGANAARRRAKEGGASATDAEEGTYDYVEVMACPGGCVNGGGQLKPPSSMLRTTDEEGHVRDWAAEGVAIDDASAEGLSTAKWGDREWTKRVEAAYWSTGLPTPPPSPPLARLGDLVTDTKTNSKIDLMEIDPPFRESTFAVSLSIDSDPMTIPATVSTRETGALQQQQSNDTLYAAADLLATRLLKELCLATPHEHPHPHTEHLLRETPMIPAIEGDDDGNDDLRRSGRRAERGRPGLGLFGWFTRMDEDAEKRRVQFFRTEYRAVESEVVGLAVKW